jgi:O-acetyl-ADP-ribose deacetylase (regulator of RNase III)
MKIILTAVENSLADAFEEFCGDLSEVHIHRGSILDLDCDAVVSPANSFGFMDGGIDAIYVRYFGAELGRRVRSLIQARHFGELPVGAADIVETNNDRIPYLVVAPTMRVPMVLKDSVNAYLAIRAAILLISHGKFESGPKSGSSLSLHIRTVAFPGMGTGVGQLSPMVCAHQFREAIEHFVLGTYSPPSTWAEASERHQLLYTDHIRSLQRSRTDP